MKTYDLTMIGLFTAVLCLLGPLAITLPFSPVPVSLGTLGVMLACTIIGTRNGLLATTLYLLLGFAGLPVFTGFTGGVGRILGPTGGYLIGYLFLAFIGGNLMNKWRRARILQALGLFVGMLFCYLFGTLWLILQTELSISGAVWVGVIPYLPVDICKIFSAVLLGRSIRKRITPETPFF